MLTKFAALVAVGAVAVTDAANEKISYRFDPQLTNGVEGDIFVQYDADVATKATISAALDFSKVNTEAIKALDGKCDGEIVEYGWHIHTKWAHDAAIGKALGECSPDFTGGHYDPTKVCGPFSEFAKAPECADKTQNYKCNPEEYARDPSVCEKGDLSGKFGNFKPDEQKKVKVEYVDTNFPAYNETTPQWNIILHAVCKENATPRIACAKVFEPLAHFSNGTSGGVYGNGTDAGYGNGSGTYNGNGNGIYNGTYNGTYNGGDNVGDQEPQGKKGENGAAVNKAHYAAAVALGLLYMVL